MYATYVALLHSTHTYTHAPHTPQTLTPHTHTHTHSPIYHCCLSPHPPCQHSYPSSALNQCLSSRYRTLSYPHSPWKPTQSAIPRFPQCMDPPTIHTLMVTPPVWTPPTSVYQTPPSTPEDPAAPLHGMALSLVNIVISPLYVHVNQLIPSWLQQVHDCTSIYACIFIYTVQLIVSCQPCRECACVHTYTGDPCMCLIMWKFAINL